MTDPQGAAVVGAEVKLIDTATNTSKSTTSNETGRFIFVNVTPAEYNVTVNKEGFKLAKMTGQKVTIGLVLSLNVKLELGSNLTTVEVKAMPGAELQVTNATVGTTMSFRNFAELPNLGRDVSALVTLQPAVTPTGEVAGAISDQNTFQLDGAQNTNDMDGSMNIYTPSYAGNGVYTGGGPPTGVMPTPIESIEEFKVSTNNQTVDFNGSSGAQVSLVTRRGTSQWHGSGYEYYLGSNFQANTWNNNRLGKPLPKNHQNRFGAAGGGPITPSFWGGKTYFFANYEGRRWPNSTTIERLVPSALLRAGVVQIQTSNGVVAYNLNPNPVTVGGVTYQPAQCGAASNLPCDPRGIGVNPIVSQIWSKFEPLPNDTKAGDTLNTQGYLTSIGLPQSDNFAVARIDHDFGQKWHFMASYRFYRLDRATTNQVDIGGALPGDTLGQAVPKSNRPQIPSFYVVGLTTNVTSNLTNDFRWNYLRNFWQWTTAAATPQLAGIGGAVEIGGESSNALIPYNVNTQQARQRFWDGQDHTVRDDLTLIHGNHLIQFGGMYQRNFDYHTRNDNGNGIMNSTVYQITSGSGVVMSQTYQPSICPSSGTPPAGCLPSSQRSNWNKYYAQVLGIVSQPQTLYTRSGPNLTLQALGTPMFDQSVIPTYNVYFSDTWHLKPTLTVTYGLGYQIEMPPYERNGKQVELVDGSGNLIVAEDYLAAKKRAALQGQLYNPTIGFATVGNVGKGLKYPYNPYYAGFSPRLSAAWNPKFDGGILGAMLGNGHTVIRGGWSRIFGRLNGVDLVLVPLLGTGLGQAVSCIGAVNAANAVGGNQCLGPGGANPVSAFRIGTDGNSGPLPSVSQTLAQPYYPGVGGNAAAGDGEVLDPHFKPSRSDQFDLTIQREISSKLLVEVGYIGRRLRNEYQPINLDAVPYMLTLGGQSFAQAYAAIEQATGFGGNMSAAVPAQPFFEAALGGATSAYCTGFANCTAAVISKQSANFASQAVYDMWSALANGTSPAFVFGRSMPSTTPAQVSSIFSNASLGHGNYNGVFASVKARDWHGLTALSNFTWGRSLGTQGVVQATSAFTVTDPWNLDNNYGPQPFDVKFLYNAAIVYQVPAFKGQQGILGRLLGGWSFSPLFTARSGFPLEVNISQGAGSDCQSFGEVDCSSGSTYENAILMSPFTAGNSRHDSVPGSNGIGTAGVGINLFADPVKVYNQFRPPILGLDNNTGGAGVLRGMSTWNLDLTVSKEIRITERFGMTFISQFTNVLNHLQLNDPSMDIYDSTNWGVIFGQANSPRQMEFGLRFHF